MYELLIIGAGPAGLTASIYASRYRLRHLVLGDICGSALMKASQVENWPGEKSITGCDLLNKFSEHAAALGAEFMAENMIGIKKEDGVFKVATSGGQTLEAQTVAICSGTKERQLGIPGEEEFLGRGVSYCAICDGAFFKGKTVAVAGGGNSAIMAAQMLSEHAEKVYVIHRSGTFRAEPVMLERAKNNPKVEILAGFNIARVKGDKRVQAIELDKEYAGSVELALDGLFIEVGMIPNATLLKDLGVEIDAAGQLVVDAAGATSEAGLFAAGDVSSGSNGIRQVLSAAAEGMIVAHSAYNFIRNK